MYAGRGFMAIALVAAALFLGLGQAQENEVVEGTYTDEKTGIKFATWEAIPDEFGRGGFTFGMVLPEDAATKDATEYIGMLRCQILAANSTGWCGVSTAGSMVNVLLLMAWPYKDQVLTSFRFVGDYFMPGLYTGNATLTQISSYVNATSYEVLFRCQNCLAWDQAGQTGAVRTSLLEEVLVLGRAQSALPPENAGCPDKIAYGFHNNGYGQWGAGLANATNSAYAEWAKSATKTVTGECESASPTVSLGTSRTRRDVAPPTLV